MAECERKTLSPLEAARSRYESLQISDDVFGESGDDSSENPFYSTSGDSNSDNYTSEINTDDIRISEAGSSHPGASGPNTLEEEGWSDTLRDITVPSYKGTCGMSL